MLVAIEPEMVDRYTLLLEALSGAARPDFRRATEKTKHIPNCRVSSRRSRTASVAGP